MGFIVVVNAVLIGLEAADERIHEQASRFEVILVFLFSFELLCRFLADGFSCLRSNWVKMDVVIVICGVLGHPTLSSKLRLPRDIDHLSIIRISRILRLGRTVRLVIKFQSLWMLTRGLIDSGATMFYTLCMISILIYVFGCIGVELITHNDMAKESGDPAFRRVVQIYFSSLSQPMLTLVQFLCMDSIGAIYKPLVERQWQLSIYFFAVILVVPILTMNLVTAVIVQSALDKAHNDREAMQFFQDQKSAIYMKEIKDLFMALDSDGSGEITLSEVESIDPADRQVLRQLSSIENPVEIFHALDIHETGSLCIDEFCDGMTDIAVKQVPLEIKRLTKQVSTMFHMMKNIHETMPKLEQQLQSLTSKSSHVPRESKLQYDDEEPKAVQTPCVLPHSSSVWAEEMLMELKDIRLRLQFDQLSKSGIHVARTVHGAESGGVKNIQERTNCNGVVAAPHEWTPSSRKVAPGEMLRGRSRNRDAAYCDMGFGCHLATAGTPTCGGFDFEPNHLQKFQAL